MSENADLDTGPAAITVVVPALNAEATLEAQLKSLDAQRTARRFEVVVVDNGSTDGTAELVAAFDASSFSLRTVEEARRGINSARNAGIHQAGNLVLLCDADDEVHPDWLEQLVAGLQAGRWVGGSVDYLGLNTARTREIWGVGERSNYLVTDPYDDRTLGCNCGFYRSMWEELGGFDVELSGAGGDEKEFFMRAYGAGYRFEHVPAAVVSYRLRPGVRSFARQRFRHGRNRIRMQRRGGGSFVPAQHSFRSATIDLVKTSASLPLHLRTPPQRFEWLAAFSRRLGRWVEVTGGRFRSSSAPTR